MLPISTLIDGTAFGTSQSGVNYTMSTDQPLEVHLDCPNVVAGILRYTPGGKETSIIDYGNGTCDKAATFTLGLFTTNLVLP